MLRFGTKGTYTLFYSNEIDSNRCFSPYNSLDGTIDLGRSTSRFGTVYANSLNVKYSLVLLKLGSSNYCAIRAFRNLSGPPTSDTGYVNFSAYIGV